VVSAEVELVSAAITRAAHKVDFLWACAPEFDQNVTRPHGDVVMTLIAG
jgi:hypothetical protein